MEIQLDDKFQNICREIVDENLTDKEWAERAYSDYFYEMPFCGGFDRETHAFIFGFYDDCDNLYSFKLRLDQIPEVLSGKIQTVNALKED